MPIEQAELTKYMTEMADAAGIPEDKRPEFLANDKIKTFAHTSLEAVAREKGRAEKASAESQRVYEENLKIYANNKAAVDQANANVAAYEAKFGKLDATTRAAAVNEEATNLQKTFEDRIKTTEGNTIGLVKSVAKITAKHLKDYNEEPDLDAIEKIAVEQNLTADKAYAEWRRPKDEAKAQATQAEAIKKAREEGEMEGRSKMAASAIADPERSSPFMSNLRKSGDVKEGPKDSFVKGWREAAQKSTGT